MSTQSGYLSASERSDGCLGFRLLEAGGLSLLVACAQRQEIAKPTPRNLSDLRQRYEEPSGELRADTGKKALEQLKRQLEALGAVDLVDKMTQRENGFTRCTVHSREQRAVCV